MLRLSYLHAGMVVFRRHFRNALRDPRRVYWIFRRIVEIVRAGALASVLERHAAHEDLYVDYATWIDRYDTLTPDERAALDAQMSGFREAPLISVILPTFNTAPDLLRVAINSVRQQIYDKWELCIADDASTHEATREVMASLAAIDSRIRIVWRPERGGIAAATNSALEIARGRYVAFLDHDDLLAEHALFRVAEAIGRNPGAKMLYSDEDRIDAQGRRSNPHFKPDWNPDWQATTNYVLHLLVVETALARSLGGMRSQFDGAQDWDFVLRAAERVEPSNIVHLPYVLYHWRAIEGSTAAGVYQKPNIHSTQRRVIEEALKRQGSRAAIVQTLYSWWIRHPIPTPAPLASIVIPSRDRVELLRACIDHIYAKNGYPSFEIIVVDNLSSDSQTLRYLDELRESGRARVMRYDLPFNYSAECNLGARAAKGEVIVLLNNDVEVISRDWLTELVTQAMRPEVGVVGGILYYPNDTIQHAGVILGLNGAGDRPYLGFRRGHSGIAGRAAAVHNVTAMVTACVAVRKDVYLRIGGMDEALPVSHNDLDFCLRVRALGLRNVLTPFAEAYHLEGASRGHEHGPDDRARAAAENEIFMSRWAELVARDPAYNPNLTLKGQAFTLAYPPRLSAQPFETQTPVSMSAPETAASSSQKRRASVGY